jgi:hypothetical protein
MDWVGYKDRVNSRNADSNFPGMWICLLPFILNLSRLLKFSQLGAQFFIQGAQNEGLTLGN